jgi:cell wall-associated NlpC family hydrolase
MLMSAPFRSACLLLLAAGLSLLLSACSTVGPASQGPIYQGPEPRLSQEQATDVALYAVGLVGTPYRYGGNTPASGFDCSGLIGHVYKSRAAVTPPRTVAQLQGWGQVVPVEQIRSGDLVLFGKGSETTHAGIFVGSGRFVHAPSTGGEVRLDRLDSRYWAAHRISYRRP